MMRECQCLPVLLTEAFSVEYLQVSEGLRALNQVTRVLRARRAEQGALSLASPEVKFELDTETHDPLDVGVYQVPPPAHCLAHALCG